MCGHDWSMWTQVPGVYTQEYPDAVLSYPSTSYLDDMAYAAAWMYFSTQVRPIVCAYMHVQQDPEWGAGKEGQASGRGPGAREGEGCRNEVSSSGRLYVIAWCCVPRNIGCD